MEQNNKQSSNTITVWQMLLTFAGTIIVAYLGYLGSKTQIEIPIHVTQTAEARLATLAAAATSTAVKLSQPTELPASDLTATPIFPYVIVQNQLVVPIKIYLNGVYKGDASELSSTTFLIDRYPMDLKWEAEKRGLADDMTNTITILDNGTTLTVNNIIGNDFYFFAMMDNYTGQNCDVMIDDGYVSQKQAGTIIANAMKTGMGYFKLFNNSNVSLHCGGDIYWVGIRPNQTQPASSILKIVAPDSGLVEFRIGP